MTNSPYTSSSFLTSGSENLNYNELDYNEKIKIKALEGLDQLAANLNAIANIKAIEFQINHLNSMTTGFTDQLTAKDQLMIIPAVKFSGKEESSKLHCTC